jgi:uncharacterized membrane protein (DUF2068 family)
MTVVNDSRLGTFVPAAEGSNAPRNRTRRLIRTIAVVKLFKAALLSCLGFGAFRLLNPAVSQRLTHWVGSFAWSHDRGFVLSVLNKLTGLEPNQLRALGIGAFLYATLFIVEGVGLWFEKRWAEYLTVIATGSLLPLELYELHVRFTYARSVAIVLNLAILLYLVWVLRRRAA